ncbi:MAG: hypothetical protein QOJ99_677 [Bryobacterales bacterium]|jgi:hypothetical protein|nr:hypothetical protein [Bryobacterales bacterium]
MRAGPSFQAELSPLIELLSPIALESSEDRIPEEPPAPAQNVRSNQLSGERRYPKVYGCHRTGWKWPGRRWKRTWNRPAPSRLGSEVIA